MEYSIRIRKSVKIIELAGQRWVRQYCICIYIITTTLKKIQPITGLVIPNPGKRVTRSCIFWVGCARCVRDSLYAAYNMHFLFDFGLWLGFKQQYLLYVKIACIDISQYNNHALIDTPLIDTFCDFLPNFRKNPESLPDWYAFFLDKSYQLGHEYCNKNGCQK